MNSKRSSLFAEAPAAAGKPAPTQKAGAAPNPSKPFLATPGRPPSRQGKKVVSVYVEPEAAKQLGILAIQEDSSIQALMVEALNDLFAKRGMNRIA